MAPRLSRVLCMMDTERTGISTPSGCGADASVSAANDLSAPEAL